MPYSLAIIPIGISIVGSIVGAAGGVGFLASKGVIYLGNSINEHAQSNRKPWVQLTCKVTGNALRVLGCVAGITSCCVTGLGVAVIGTALGPVGAIAGTIAGIALGGIMIHSIIKDLSKKHPYSPIIIYYNQQPGGYPIQYAPPLPSPPPIQLVPVYIPHGQN